MSIVVAIPVANVQRANAEACTVLKALAQTDRSRSEELDVRHFTVDSRQPDVGSHRWASSVQGWFRSSLVTSPRLTWKLPSPRRLQRTHSRTRMQTVKILSSDKDALQYDCFVACGPKRGEGPKLLLESS